MFFLLISILFRFKYQEHQTRSYVNAYTYSMIVRNIYSEQLESYDFERNLLKNSLSEIIYLFCKKKHYYIEKYKYKLGNYAYSQSKTLINKT